MEEFFPPVVPSPVGCNVRLFGQSASAPDEADTERLLAWKARSDTADIQGGTRLNRPAYSVDWRGYSPSPQGIKLDAQVPGATPLRVTAAASPE